MVRVLNEFKQMGSIGCYMYDIVPCMQAETRLLEPVLGLTCLL